MHTAADTSKLLVLLPLIVLLVYMLGIGKHYIATVREEL